MKIHWTDHALAQLQSIHDYIAQDAPVYATQVDVLSVLHGAQEPPEDI